MQISVSEPIEERVRNILETLPTAAYLCDRDGLITYFNGAAIELWGRSPALNSPVDRFCGSFRLFAPEGLPIAPSECWMALALSTGLPQLRKEIVIERPDGTRVVALASASPLRNEADELVGAINVLVDLSERRLADTGNAMLAAIVESSDDAIVSKSLDGYIQTWNGGAERIFGYTTAEVIGRPITMIIPKERLAEETDILERLRRGERVDHFETERLHKEGRRIDVSLTVSPIRDHTGRIVGASKVARDVTDKKAAERALIEADRRKDEFLATLAHELRNPLAPLVNSLHLLRLSDELSPAAERLHSIMERQLNHLVHLVDDLLDVSRITRGVIELKRQPVDLASIITTAVETSRPAIDEAGHQFAISISPEPLMIYADAVRISQVIANLLHNAAKYSEPGGQIWLTVKRAGDRSIISVRDNGMGIPSEMLGRVFDMFSQAEHTLSRAQGGLGIGLTLANSLVQLHGGRIEARSAGLGKGSEFVVTLPLMKSNPNAGKIDRNEEAPPAPGEPAGASVKSTRVLVVDDTQASAFVLSKLLETMGHEVQAAHDGASALEQARNWRPDVIISDIAMPDMDGYELARRLRREPALEGTVLAALTGYSQESDRRQALSAGFDHHLVKPVSIESLEDLIRRVGVRTA